MIRYEGTPGHTVHVRGDMGTLIATCTCREWQTIARDHATAKYRANDHLVRVAEGIDDDAYTWPQWDGAGL